MTRQRTVANCNAAAAADLRARPNRSYSAHPREQRQFEGIDVTTPEAGFYRCKLVSGGVRGAVRIWFGPPRDPDTGEEMDRSHRFQAEFEGVYIELDRIWPQCAGEPISDDEYRRYYARAEWARQNAPESAFADRKRRYDPLSASTPMPF